MFPMTYIYAVCICNCFCYLTQANGFGEGQGYQKNNACPVNRKIMAHHNRNVLQIRIQDFDVFC